ncbi:hypothetical protein MATL_G00136490 [Megalops atlanticus]|uniref:Uncharacterized protein n=1 Tax=Megalops atlanticus TaxID=7932 RepID=A0A9D3PWG1_MEGAT|nr:hypothetical protein MATL_G00136490 [Megalops atlanticus]
MSASKSKASPGKRTAKAPKKGPAKPPKKGQTVAPQRKKPQVSQSAVPKGKHTEPGDKMSCTDPNKQKALSREEQAAVTIQCAVRQLLAKRERVRRERERQEYEELMERLQKEAFVALVQREQEEAEREKRKEEEERRKKREEQLLHIRLLEAAFDGEVEEILAVLKEVSDRDTKNGIGFDDVGQRQRSLHQLHVINITDANGNTALSEAAGGGQTEVIILLQEKGADVNTQHFTMCVLLREPLAGRPYIELLLGVTWGQFRLCCSWELTPEFMLMMAALRNRWLLGRM